MLERYNKTVPCPLFELRVSEGGLIQSKGSLALSGVPVGEGSVVGVSVPEGVLVNVGVGVGVAGVVVQVGVGKEVGVKVGVIVGVRVGVCGQVWVMVAERVFVGGREVEVSVG